MDRMLNCFEKIAKNIVIGLFLMMTVMLAFMSVFMTVMDYETEEFTFSIDRFWLNIVSMALLVALGVFLKRNQRYLGVRRLLGSRCFFLGVAIFNMIAMALWILGTQFTPGADQKLILQVVEAMSDGDYSDWNEGFNYYMYIYPYQNGIVLFYYFISKIIGLNQYVICQLLNVPFLVIGILAVYRICRQLWKDRDCSNGLVFLAMSLWVPFSFYVIYVYGNIIGFAMSALAIMWLYEYLGDGRKVKCFLSGLSIGIASVLKPNFAIFFVAMLAMLFLHWLRERKLTDLPVFVVLVALFFGCKVGVNLITEGITGVATPKGIPKTAWIAMGITGNETYGWWNGYTLFVFNRNNHDYSAANAEAVGYIVDRLKTFLSTPMTCLKFYFYKISTIWLNPLFESISIQSRGESMIGLSGLPSALLDTGSTVFAIFLRITDVTQSLVYTGAACFMWLKRKMVKSGELIFAVLFIGGFLFELMWESKCQYTIFFFYLLIPYAIHGWSAVVDAVEKRLCKRHGDGD